MVEAARSRAWRRTRNWVAGAAGVIAAVVGSVQLAQEWKETLFGPQQPSALTQAPGSSAETNRNATHATIQTMTGDVAQDNSRNVVLYNNAFRVEVVRATDDAPEAKRQLRDEILGVLDGLLGEGRAPALSPEQARALGQRLGTILEEAPISAYRIAEREFTLKPGAAWLLPGGDDSIAFVGPAKDGAPHAITIRRNGRESTMAVGAVREFRQGTENCRLLLHEVAQDFSAATFSYACRS